MRFPYPGARFVDRYPDRTQLSATDRRARDRASSRIGLAGWTALSAVGTDAHLVQIAAGEATTTSRRGHLGGGALEGCSQN
jgi:hypothetical protein